MIGTLFGMTVASGAGMPKPGIVEPPSVVRAVNSNATCELSLARVMRAQA
jgi:hypothetical protein